VEDVDEVDEAPPHGSSSSFAQQIKKSIGQDNKQDMVFVNMLENRESYTAYNGSHVWKAIYQENCMLERIK
jgi:hypothetical protein